MKTELTIEESANLIGLGVDPKLASKEVATDVCEEEYSAPRHPIFTLTDILSILPEKIKIHRDGDTLSMIFHCGQWRVGYTNCAVWCEHTKVAPELIDALYQLLIWAIENKFINLNTDKKWTDSTE